MMKKSLQKFFSVTLSLILLLIFWSCKESVTDHPFANKPPKTFLWIFPDSSIAEGVSKQRLHWWGEDEDGYVKGYLFAFVTRINKVPVPDTITYTFTTTSDTTVQFPLYVARDTFLVVVRAVDNTFKGNLRSGDLVRLSPSPYRVNSGVNEPLKDFSLAYDLVGAKQAFPVRNTPPTVEFQKDASTQSTTVHPPDTTFTVASFSWVGTDPDGDQTLAGYRLALNDTTADHWLTVSANVSMITLLVPRSRSDNLTSGTVTADVYSGMFPTMRYLGTLPGLNINALNKIYLQARDIAGDYSKLVSLPEGSRKWYVKNPKSKLLVISDYMKNDSLSVRSFYRKVFAQVAAGKLADYDELNIRYDVGNTKPGPMVPSILNPAFVHTLKLFDYVVWYTDKFPSLTVAQFPLYLYTSTGGKVIFTTEFMNAVSDPRGSLVDFAPLDSIFPGVLPPPSRPSLGDTRIPKNFIVRPDSESVSVGYPLLNFDSLTVEGAPTVSFDVFMRPIYRRADARYIYKLQPDSRDPLRYTGEPHMAVIDNEKRFVFFGLPLHYLDGRATGGKGIVELLNTIFIKEFGLQ